MLDIERHHDRRLQLHNNRHRSFLKYAKVGRGYEYLVYYMYAGTKILNT